MGELRFRVGAKGSYFKCTTGFTLIEVIVVIALLGILVGIAVPRFIGYKALAAEMVCETNRNSAERLYQAFQVDEANTGIIFDQFYSRILMRVVLMAGRLVMRMEKFYAVCIVR